MLLQIVFIVLIAGALVALLMNFRRGRGGFGGLQRAQLEAGTLRITGVSPRPAGQGEQFVTITGTLSGPSVPGETVYGRFAWDVNQWPFPGEDLPVSYPPGKPQHWRIGHPSPGPEAGY
ncbi:hypothetical protein [Nocardia veterana]|uniref:Uncharacterized protein n=1 Tax=Nocardia veterana TaxID=132249 RepID=A0A7X6RG94_9NOCA|nr:hypothetical protein [Nocardia veterana]NKY84665.1 hypothetical protein [Nocardia veterana]